MWSKSANFLIVKVKIKGHWGFSFPLSFNVVNELFGALEDLAWVGEGVLKRLPDPKDEHARKQLQWVKRISPSGAISGLRLLVSNLQKHKGLEFVDVEVDNVMVKVYLR